MQPAAWINYLDHTEPIKDPTQQYDAVAQEDLAQNQVKWLTRSPANNTYAIGVKSSTANRLGVKIISDYARLVSTNPSDASMCVASEFAGRSDGLPGLEKAYGFTVPKDGLATLAEGAIYDAISKGDPCNFGEITTTDGRIQALDLTVPQDDKQFFPVYNPARTVRETVYNDHQDLAKIAEPIAVALVREPTSAPARSGTSRTSRSSTLTFAPNLTRQSIMSACRMVVEAPEK